MAYNNQGQWVPEDDSVSSRLTGLLAQNNPLMEKARTTGAQFANRRGLLNSSLASEASQKAMLDVALPIASQEAQQTYGKNIQEMGNRTQKDVAQMNVAAHDRQYVAAAISELSKKHGAIQSEIIKNNDVPSDARNKYLANAAALRDSELNLIEQIYGVDLDWTTASITI